MQSRGSGTHYRKEKNMGRLIDADRLMAHYSWWGNDDETKRLFDEIIEAQETAPAVYVVRCRECRFYGEKYGRCGILDTSKTPDGFCDEAVRRGKE